MVLKTEDARNDAVRPGPVEIGVDHHRLVRLVSRHVKFVERGRLVRAARESLARHRRAEQEREAERERARESVRQMRAGREAATVRQEGIADALLQIVGDGSPRRYARMLPENDLDGDRVDDWEALVRRVSRLCGAEIDSAEVAAVLRGLVAAGVTGRPEKRVTGG